MAYTNQRGGPYPNKSGEYCGNHLPGGMAYAMSGETHEQTQQNQELYLATMRFGRPRPCKAGTTDELIARGWVGLYLKEDSPLVGNDIDCETPEFLLEPPPDAT